MFISGWQQTVTILLAIIPGFIYQGTRGRLRGPTPEEQEITVRILRALAMSGFLTVVYVIVLGPHLTTAATNPTFFTDAQHPQDPRRIALAVMFLVFVVPATFAWIVHTWKTHLTVSRWRIKRIEERFSMYDPTATAWDFAADHMGRGFVRVYTSDNTWVGGRSEDKSYFSGYPETREIYLQEAWELDEDGQFVRPIQGTAGVWIRCDDAQFVQFLEAGETTAGQSAESSGAAAGDQSAESRETAAASQSSKLSEATDHYIGERLVALLPLRKGRRLRVSVTDDG